MPAGFQGDLQFDGLVAREKTRCAHDRIVILAVRAKIYRIVTTDKGLVCGSVSVQNSRNGPAWPTGRQWCLGGGRGYGGWEHGHDEHPDRWLLWSQADGNQSRRHHQAQHLLRRIANRLHELTRRPKRILGMAGRIAVHDRTELWEPLQ